jgi:hypothetical protein
MAFDPAALQRHQALMADLQLLHAEKAAIEQSVGLDAAADDLADVARRAAAAKRAAKTDRFKGPRPAPTRRSERALSGGGGSSAAATSSSSSSSVAALAAPATWASLSPAVRARELRRRALPKLPGVAKVYRCVPGELRVLGTRPAAKLHLSCRARTPPWTLRRAWRPRGGRWTP